MSENLLNPTCGVSGIDDAEDSGMTVPLGGKVSSLQLLSIQCPAISLIQVVVDVHCLQLCDSCRVQRVLWDGNHHACPGTAPTGYEQLQDALETKDKKDEIHVC